MVGAVCTPTFIAVPVVTIWAGVFPIVLNFWAAIALTVYYISTSSVHIALRQIWSQITKCSNWFLGAHFALRFFSAPAPFSHRLLPAICSCCWRLVSAQFHACSELLLDLSCIYCRVTNTAARTLPRLAIQLVTFPTCSECSCFLSPNTPFHHVSLLILPVTDKR